MLIVLLIPGVVQNLELGGVPLVAVFDLNTSTRAVHGRTLRGRTLTFVRADSGRIRDHETGSVWDVVTGTASEGEYLGHRLPTTDYGIEDVFPYLGVTPDANPLLAVWQRFDTNWYLALAGRGYAANDVSNVYFPLYPLTVHALGLVVGNDLLAALLISNLALIIALVLLYRLTNELMGETAARRTLAYLVLFPTSFFLFAAYTESLFLALALAALTSARRGQWLWAALWGMLAALTRLQGLLLIVPLFALWWSARAPGPSLGRARQGLALLALPGATSAFLMFNRMSLLSSYVGELHTRFVWPWENVAAAVSSLPRSTVTLMDLANLLITLGLAVLLGFVWKRLPRELALYAVVMFLAPLFRMTDTQPLVSMARYVLVLFPVFMVLGFAGGCRRLNRALVYLSLLGGLYLSAQFWLWGWVA